MKCGLCKQEMCVGDEGRFTVQRGRIHETLEECVAAISDALDRRETYELEQSEKS